MSRSLTALAVVIAVYAALHLPGLAAQSTTRLTGVVRQGQTDRPLPGARLVIRRGAQAVAQATSDHDGRVEVTIPAGAPVDVTVTKAGYAPLLMTASAGVEPLALRLTPGAVIRGRVVDAAGRPSQGFAVLVRRTGGTGAAPGTAVTTLTNDLGEYRVGSLPAGTYEVGEGNAAAALLGAALPPGLPRGGPPGTQVEVRAGEETTQDITRPPSPPTTPAAAAAQSKALSGLAQAFGGLTPPAIDPATAGRVTGTVTSADGSRPDAVVTFVAEDGSATFAAITDDEGRYAVEEIPPGRYHVLAQGFSMAAGRYGATPGNRSGTSLEVRPRQRLERIDIALPRATVIGGRVLDVYGEPLEGMKVEAWQLRVYDGRPTLTPAIEAALASATTDDRGQYRLAGLAPGRYVVVASEPAAAASPASTQNLAQAAMSQVIGLFSAPGRAHAYYPGRPTAQEATPVVVDVGDLALGLDMTFAPAAGVPVSGVVFGPDGMPVSAQLTLIVSRRSGAPAVPPYRVTSRTDGTFTFLYVAPGDYVLHAEAQGPGAGNIFNNLLSTVGASFGGGVTSVNVTGGGATRNPVFDSITWSAATVPPFGTSFVQVTGGGAPSIVVRTSTGFTLTGRLAFEGPTPAGAPTEFAVGFAPADPDLSRPFVPAARTSADGTIEAVGLVGPMRLMAVRTPDGWWLKSAVINGVDAVEQPVSFDASSLDAKVDVVFSSAPSGVRGRVVSQSGAPVRGATVLAFPADITRWYPGTRYVRQAFTTDGTFEMAALAPGSYYVLAVDHVSAATVTNWQESELLERLIPLAQSVTVREGSFSQLQANVAARVDF